MKHLRKSVKYAVANAVIVGGALGIGATVYTIMPKNELKGNQITNQIIMQQNVEKANKDIKSFKESAVTVVKDNDGYLFQLFGTVLFENDNKPKLSILNYAVDERIYSLVNKNFKVEYKYTEDGKIASVMNVLADGNDPYKYFEEAKYIDKMYEELSKITQNKYDSLQIIGDEEDLIAKTSNKTNDKNIQILEITNPEIDNKQNVASFGMSVLNGENVEFVDVLFPLTDKIKQNPNLVYDEYLNGKGEFDIYNKVNLKHYINNSNNINEDFELEM